MFSPNTRLLLALVLVAFCHAAVDPTRNCTGSNIPVPPTRTDTTQRVAALRAKMAAAGIEALIIPTDDDHQNEYVGAHDEKRVFISGFRGSAGTVLVTKDHQLLWTDGRYFLQAEDELDCNWWLMRSGEKGVPSLTEWIIDNIDAGKKVAADPKVISSGSWKSYKKTFTDKGLVFAGAADLVGEVWDAAGGRPLASDNVVEVLAQEFAGRTWKQKIDDLKSQLSDAKVDALVVSALDDLAWLFNLRGSDIAYNPVFFAYAIVETEANFNPKLYLRDAANRTAALKSHLNSNDDGTCSTTTGNCVEVLDYVEIDNGVSAFDGKNKTIWISDDTNYHISSKISDERNIKTDISPIMLMKAIKNDVERQGMRNAHLRDSMTICELAAKVEKELNAGSAAWDELKVIDTIDNMRKANTNNKGLSFNTICGSGQNGAYIHYSASNATNNAVNKNNMLLLDSGGQYLDGTTDITRTFHFGEPTDFQKLAYTLVLQGVIDLAMAKFPANRTLGSSLDTLARRPLWGHGLDFGHGTGHGIGMFLSVHEGPSSIGQRRASSRVSTERPLYDGMFFSDEPGYYDADQGFGIRLETIIMARYVKTDYGKPNTTLEFEPIALVPFEKKLIKLETLNRDQRVWLNEYHEQCEQKTGVSLQKAGKTDAYNWVKARTPLVPLDDGPDPTASPNIDTTPNGASSLSSTVQIGLVAATFTKIFL